MRGVSGKMRLLGTSALAELLASNRKAAAKVHALNLLYETLHPTDLFL